MFDCSWFGSPGPLQPLAAPETAPEEKVGPELEVLHQHVWLLLFHVKKSAFSSQCARQASAVGCPSDCDEL